MRVVLLQDVKNVGRVGDVKDIADGYAKNYLLPAGLAALATSGAMRQAEEIKNRAKARAARSERETAVLASKLEGQTVEIWVKAGAEGGRIYGSVTTEDIAEALHKKVGFEVDKKRIDLERPIHELGAFPVTVKLSSSSNPRVTVVVKGE